MTTAEKISYITAFLYANLKHLTNIEVGQFHSKYEGNIVATQVEHVSNDLTLVGKPIMLNDVLYHFTWTVGLNVDYTEVLQLWNFTSPYLKDQSASTIDLIFELGFLNLSTKKA